MFYLLITCCTAIEAYLGDFRGLPPGHHNKAGIEINRITNGPVVNQYMQTSKPSLFACGNVVHVNDLVDNVSKESEVAGKYAALYAMGKLSQETKEISVKTGSNVRYVCPHKLNVTNENEKVTLFFRVLSPDNNVTLRVVDGEKVITKKRELRVNPGEMCNVVIETAKISGDSITVEVVKEA